MAGEAQRGAVFTLKARTDESVGREFAAIGERAAQLQAMLGNFKLGGLDVGEFETTVDREHARLDALHQRAMSPVNLTPIATSQIATQQPTGARSLPSPAGADTALEKVVAQHEAAEAKMDAATTTGAARRAAANGHAAKVEAEQEAALTQKVDAENEKQADAERQAADKRAEAEAKAVDQCIAGWDKETAAHARDEDRKLAAANKTRAAFVAGGGEAVEQDQQTHESAARKVEELNSRLRASLAEVGNSAAEVARGFVEMGLVSEEDFNKIKDSILSIQEAMDRISGGIKLWKSITEAAKLYREQIAAITNAKKTLAAVDGGRAAASAAGGAASAAEGAAAGESAKGIAGAVGARLAAAVTPVTIGAAAIGAAIYVAAKFALDKWVEASEEGAKKDAEERKKELEIREAQNAALAKIFAAEDRARQQQHAQQDLAQRISRQYGAGREEYERQADALVVGRNRGDQLSPAARAQVIDTKRSVDAAEDRRKQIEADLAAAQAKETQSREAEKELPRAPAPGMTPADQKRLEGIARERAEIEARMRERQETGRMSDQTDPMSGPLSNRVFGTSQERDRARLVEIDLEKAKLQGKNKPAAGFNQFASDEKSADERAQQIVDLTRQKGEIEAEILEKKRAAYAAEAAALDEQLQKQQQLVAADKQRVSQAKEYARQQHDAFQSALAGFAQLTRGQQQRLIKIQEKLNRGEELGRSDEQFGAQHLGEKGRQQLRDRQAKRVDQPTRELLFGDEEQKEGKANAELSLIRKQAEEHNKLLQQIRDRITALGAAPVGGERAELKVDAKGSASVQLTWDKPSSQIIAKAMQPALDEWHDAIQDMLADTIARAKFEWLQEVQRLIQKKSQAGAAGA